MIENKSLKQEAGYIKLEELVMERERNFLAVFIGLYLTAYHNSGLDSSPPSDRTALVKMKGTVTGLSTIYHHS